MCAGLITLLLVTLWSQPTLQDGQSGESPNSGSEIAGYVTWYH